MGILSSHHFSTYNLLEQSAEVKECIQKTASPNLDIVPSHIDLVAAEIELVDRENREYMLREALKSVRDDYDYTKSENKRKRPIMFTFDDDVDRQSLCGDSPRYSSHSYAPATEDFECFIIFLLLLFPRGSLSLHGHPVFNSALLNPSTSPVVVTDDRGLPILWHFFFSQVIDIARPGGVGRRVRR